LPLPFLTFLWYISAGMNLRPALKIPVLLFVFLAAAVLLGAAGLTFISRSLPDVRYLSDPGVSFQITVHDWEGNNVPFTVGPGNPSWTPLSGIPLHLRNAVLAGEDFSFYSHNGVDWYEVKESFYRNLKLGRYVRGASTITQQLAKNLFLSREKTLTRKIRELILARRFENVLSKDRILELYLNVVELGELVYGIGEGSRYHFGKDTAEISLRESTFLVAMLPGPRVYNPEKNMDRVMNRSDHLLSVMLKGRMISEEEYLAALEEMPFASNDEYPGMLLPDMPIQQEEGVSIEDTMREVGTIPPGEDTGPVPVPIPDYTEAEVENAGSTAGGAARGSSTGGLSR